MRSKTVSDPFETTQDEEFDVDLEALAATNPAKGESYTFVCTDVISNVGKESGVPKFEFNFELFAGMPVGDKPGNTNIECIGWEDQVHCSKSKAALWKMEQVLVALGVGEPGTKVSFKRSDVVGVLVYGAVEESEFNGRVSVRLDTVSPYAIEPGKRVELKPTDQMTGDAPF